MDVARAPLHRVLEDPLHQLDHRRVVDLRLGGKFLFLLGDHLDVVALVLELLEDVLELLVDRVAVVLVNERPQGELAREHREDIVPGDELEVVHQPEVGRVRHCHREGPALPLERQHHLLRGHIGRNQPQDPGVHLEPAEVHCRHAVLAGQEPGHVQLGGKPQLDHHQSQPRLRRLLLSQRLAELITGDQPFLEEDLPELLSLLGCRSSHCWSEKGIAKEPEGPS